MLNKRSHLIALLQRIKKNPIHFVLITMTAPAIYGLIIPVVFLDLFVSLYQFICFGVYKIPKVKRSKYISLDRKKLAHLNTVQKFNCLYCDYANGILAYVSEVAGRTEWY